MGVRGKAAGAPVPPRQGEEPEENIPASDRDVWRDENEKKGRLKPGDLTDPQRAALTQNWAGKIANQKAILEEKEAEARSEKGKLRNLYKQVKAELGDEGKGDIEDLLKLDTDAGKAALEERLKRIVRVFEWGNIGLGEQLSLALEKYVDIRPAGEIAKKAGRIAAHRGETRKPPENYKPGSECYQEWLQGFQDGQDELMKGFKPLDGLPAEGPPPPETAPEPEAPSSEQVH